MLNACCRTMIDINQYMKDIYDGLGSSNKIMFLPKDIGEVHNIKKTNLISFLCRRKVVMWIDAQKNPPKRNQRVLLDINGITIGLLILIDNKKYWYINGEQWAYTAVERWMPLPLTQKEIDNND